MHISKKKRAALTAQVNSVCFSTLADSIVVHEYANPLGNVKQID